MKNQRRFFFAGVILIFSIFSAGIFLPTGFSFAHSGGTDASGCHTCRTNCSSWGLSYGEYHCHNAKTPYQPKSPVTCTYGSGCEYAPQYEYGGSYNSTPTCPSNSRYDSISGDCKCNYGYVVSSSSCVSGSSYCWSKYGYNSSFNSLNKSCECDSGYSLSSGTCTKIQKPIYYQTIAPTPFPTPLTCTYGFLPRNGRCISNTQDCINSYGPNVSGVPGTDNSSCSCVAGYVWNTNKTACIWSTPTPAPTYTFKPSNQYCVDLHGYNSYWSGTLNISGAPVCDCKTGYIWDATKTSCIQLTPTPTPDESKYQNLVKQVNNNLKEIQKQISSPSPTSASCKDGYIASIDKKKCYRLPTNAHIANDGKNVWLCNDGYIEKGNSCVLNDSASLPIPTPTPTPEIKKSFWGKLKFW